MVTARGEQWWALFHDNTRAKLEKILPTTFRDIRSIFAITL